MSHTIWVIQIPAWMFTWRIFWAFRRFWIDLLGIEPARWLLDVPSGWKQVKSGHNRSFTYSCNSSDFFKSFQIRFLSFTPSDRKIQDHWIRLVNLGRNFRIIFLGFLIEWQWRHQIWHHLRICLLFWMFYFNFRAELNKLGTFRDPWTGSGLPWPVWSPDSGPFLIINELALCEGSTRSKSRIIFSVISFNFISRIKFKSPEE